MTTRWTIECGRAVTVLCAAACAQVYAADTPQSHGLEEVVVTATKRGETDVQKTAESIYAVGGDDLSLKRETTFEAFVLWRHGPRPPGWNTASRDFAFRRASQIECGLIVGRLAIRAMIVKFRYTYRHGLFLEIPPSLACSRCDRDRFSRL